MPRHDWRARVAGIARRWSHHGSECAPWPPRAQHRCVSAKQASRPAGLAGVAEGTRRCLSGDPLIEVTEELCP